MPLGREVGLGPCDIVLNGEPALPEKKDTAARPRFSAHVYCGQTAGGIKMPLGMEVDLGPGPYVALDGDPVPPPKGHSTPTIRRMCIVAKTAAWIKMPLGAEVDGC